MMSGTSSAVPPPPPWAQRLVSDDPDEVTAWATRRDGEHSRVVHGTGLYGFQLALIEGRSVRLAWASTRLASTLRGRFRQPTIHVPLRGTQQYAFGRQRIDAAAGRLVFMAPGTEATRYGEGHPILAIELDTESVRHEVLNRQGSDRIDWPLVPRVWDMAELRGRELLEAITGFIDAQLLDSSTLNRTYGESRLLAALANVLALSADGGIPALSVQRLGRLEDWIDSHLGETITLGRLCELARVGERSLQLAFQARRGMSPLRFVAERRLAAAHRRFSKARSDEGVTAIATSVGFTHLGRFSRAYCATFGESPSRALMRGRR